MPELRKDPLSNRWVIISAERGKRPGDFILPKTEKKGDFCPFCTGNEGITPPETYALRDNTAPDTSGWQVRVVPNKFPALSPEGTSEKQMTGIYQQMAGIGIHEVIIETTDHNRQLNDLSNTERAHVLDAYLNRFKALANDPRLNYIMLFKNSGLLAGASLEHPHTQLIALPLTPKSIEEELSTAITHYNEHNTCVFCDMIQSEIKNQSRIVDESEHFIAFCPYAPRFAFETWIFPKTHQSEFTDLTDGQKHDLSGFWGNILKRQSNVLNDPPYNFMLHTAPISHANKSHFHWHLEIAPYLNNIAGFERGTDYYINPTPPEDAAEHLRKASI